MRSMCIGAIAIAALALAGPPAGRAAEGADDSARNARDRYGATATPTDQGSSPSDLAITRTIRQQVVKDDSLSTNAKNAKIVTQDGVVALRGPVASQAEKDAVAGIASRAPGVKRVDDQLEVEGGASR